VAVGADGNLWFSEGLANQVGYMSLAPAALASRAVAPTQARQPGASTSRPGSARPALLAPLPSPAPTVTPSSSKRARVGASDSGASITADTVIRTFVDGQGLTISLPYGRAAACTGDFGWAHIVDKHVLGNWPCPGILTTFPDLVGAATEESVQALIYMALQEPPVPSGNRFLYRWPVPGTPYPIDVVVTSPADGSTIITSFPRQ
jgi:hypothetical protein